MRVLRLIFAEVGHRKVGFLLACVAVAAAVALSVALVITQEASQRETRRNMRDIGFNVRIVPRETAADELYRLGYSPHTMEEDALHRMAAQAGISYNHLVGTLTGRREIQGFQALVIGLSAEFYPPGRKKPPMGFSIDPGTVYLGAAAAEALGLAQGARLELSTGDPAPEGYEVVKVLSASGTADDVTVFCALADAQRILSQPGRINEIKAIDCLCLTADQNPAAILREELERVLPEARVLHLTAMADARAGSGRPPSATPASSFRWWCWWPGCGLLCWPCSTFASGPGRSASSAPWAMAARPLPGCSWGAPC